MRELLRRFAYLWNRRRLEREMAEEMAYHRELLPPERRAEFGSDLQLREDAREVWGWSRLDRLRQDLAYGARVLRKSPGFTLAAMLVLGSGIGVPLTVFRAALSDLQGGPIPDPDTLVLLSRSRSRSHSPPPITSPNSASYPLAMPTSALPCPWTPHSIVRAERGISTSRPAKKNKPALCPWHLCPLRMSPKVAKYDGAHPSYSLLEAVWRGRVKHARRRYIEKVVISDALEVECQGLRPGADLVSALAYCRALQMESQALRTYMQVLKTYTGLMVSGILPPDDVARAEHNTLR